MDEFPVKGNQALFNHPSLEDALKTGQERIRESIPGTRGTDKRKRARKLPLKKLARPAENRLALR